MYPFLLQSRPLRWRARKAFHSSPALVSHSFSLCSSATMAGVGLWTLGFQKLQAHQEDQTCLAWCLDSAVVQVSKVGWEYRSCCSPVPLTRRAFLQPLHHLAEFWCCLFSMLVVILNFFFFLFSLCSKTEESVSQFLGTTLPVCSTGCGSSLCYYHCLYL